MCLYRLEAEKADCICLWVSESQKSELRQNFRGEEGFFPQHGLILRIQIWSIHSVLAYFYSFWGIGILNIYDISGMMLEPVKLRMILMQWAGRPPLSCPVMGATAKHKPLHSTLCHPLHWRLMSAELLGTGTERESLPHPPDLRAGFQPHWHRHRELCFTFHPLLLNKSHC